MKNIEEIFKEMDIDCIINDMDDFFTYDFTVDIVNEMNMEFLAGFLGCLACKKMFYNICRKNKRFKENLDPYIQSLIENSIVESPYYWGISTSLVSEYLKKHDLFDLDVFTTFNLKGMKEDLNEYLNNLDTADFNLEAELSIVDALIITKILLSEKDIKFKKSEKINIYREGEVFRVTTEDGQSLDMNDVENEYIFDMKLCDNVDNVDSTPLERFTEENIIILFYSLIFLDIHEFLFHNDNDEKLIKIVKEKLDSSGLNKMYNYKLTKCENDLLC